MITNDVSSYINLLVRVVHIICNDPVHCAVRITCIYDRNHLPNIDATFSVSVITYFLPFSVLSFPSISLEYSAHILSDLILSNL